MTLPKLRLSLLVTLLSVSALAAPRPRLVVLLVVDQLRADGLRPVYGRLLPPGSARAPGGFRYLLERGAYWPLAEYDVAQCMTGPGHATIATGAYPARHGIVSNSWWTGEAPAAGAPPPLVACVAPNAQAPAQGESPSRLRAPTLGDTLKERDARSRVVTLALKSRAAILLGGYGADLALWLDGAALAWKSSPYYTERRALPAALTALNARLAAEPAEAIHLLGDTVAGLDARPLPSPLPRRAAPDDVARIGQPAALRGPSGGPGLCSSVAADLTVDAAIALLEDDELALGRDDVPDLLAVSFSAHDLIAHTLGPQSPELYASTLGEDRAIARLLKAVAARVPGGLEATLVALTADHGGPAIPEDVAAQGQPAKVIDTEKLLAALTDDLDHRFPGVRPQAEPWFAAWARSNLWLNPAVIDPESPEWANVLAEVKRFALTAWGDVFADASTSAERRAGVWPVGALGQQLRNLVVEGLSGHVVFTPRPGAFDESAGDLVSHMTGYAYDRMVPMAIAGPGVRPGVLASHAEVVDLAPSLAFLLGMLPPAAATGTVRYEAIDAGKAPWTAAH